MDVAPFVNIQMRHTGRTNIVGARHQDGGVVGFCAVAMTVHVALVIGDSFAGLGLENPYCRLRSRMKEGKIQERSAATTVIMSIHGIVNLGISKHCFKNFCRPAGAHFVHLLLQKP